ncbi:hypothetical protein [Infirmifilum sp. NZ]|uniref:hypothetical protein n=1 Tax=Infirmifilum sp. NZ TaxID=2926850 RepID=UPI00279F8D12|nr:hypothetical protein [Infirmifilum sp. NZ]UNQ73560.1 hypothetical protein MOV14_00755 [Infirmifilum sp. NZ]
MIVEADREVWGSVARWLELTGLAKTLWRLTQPRPLSKAFSTRNSRYIASTLERLHAAGLVREAVAGGTRYVYLTGRACGKAALRLIRCGAGAASGVASLWLCACISSSSSRSRRP